MLASSPTDRFLGRLVRKTKLIEKPPEKGIARAGRVNNLYREAWHMARPATALEITPFGPQCCQNNLIPRSNRRLVAGRNVVHSGENLQFGIRDFQNVWHQQARGHACLCRCIVFPRGAVASWGRRR